MYLNKLKCFSAVKNVSKVKARKVENLIQRKKEKIIVICKMDQSQINMQKRKPIQSAKHSISPSDANLLNRFIEKDSFTAVSADV